MGLGIYEWYLGDSSEAILDNMEYGYVVWSGVYQHHYSKSKTNNLGYNTYYSNNSIVIWIYLNWTMWFYVVRILDQDGVKNDLGG
jgi:hypothetical protein